MGARYRHRPFLAIVPAKPCRQLEVNGHYLINLASNLATGVLGRAHVHIGLAARDQGYEIGDRLSGKLPKRTEAVKVPPDTFPVKAPLMVGPG